MWDTLLKALELLANVLWKEKEQSARHHKICVDLRDLHTALEGIIAQAKVLFKNPVVTSAIVNAETTDAGLVVTSSDVSEYVDGLRRQVENLRDVDVLFRRLEPILAIKFQEVSLDLDVQFRLKSHCVILISERIEKVYRIKEARSSSGHFYFTPEMNDFLKKSRDNLVALQAATSKLRTCIDSQCSLADLV